MNTTANGANCQILSNSPALHSLKRQQLVQLCKRNGIKATGKNADIVEKLKAHALNHPSPLSMQPYSSGDEEDKENLRIPIPRPSEAWTVIEEDSREVERVHLGLKDIREEVEQEMSTMSPMKGFGASNSSGEFGNGTTSSKGSSMSSSLKAFATSLKRGGSKTSIAPSLSNKLAMHTEEPIIDDILAATSTPYHEHPPTYPPLPEPEPLDADDSRDQSMLDLGVSTIRLVTTAHIAESPPALRPFTPAFEPSYSPGSPSVPSIYPPLLTSTDADPNPPGGFLSTFSTPSRTRAPAQPFLFGSPAHKISNTEFHSAAATVLAEMNARLGLTGTTNEVGLDILQDRPAPVVEPVCQGKPHTDVTSKFDRAHEREFERMEGLSAWYAKRAGASPGKDAGTSTGVGAGRKRKSDALGGAPRRPIGPSNARSRRSSRVVTPGTRRSLLAAAEGEDGDGRRAKRVRISVVEAKRTQTANIGSDDESAMDVDAEKLNEEKERERAAIKKKLEISRARRRSSMGRVSVGGGRPPLIPNQPKKGMATKFGFLSSAKTLVKSVWNKGIGASTGQASKPASTLPVPKPSQTGNAPVAKKPTPNVLVKPNSALKPSATKLAAAKASITSPDPNTSLRVPLTGLGRKASTMTGTGSTVGTRSSTATSAVGRTSTISSTTSSGIPAARRAPIPSFQPTGRMSRTNSLASAGGTTGSRTSIAGTTSSRAASSIGMRKSGFVPTRTGDAGTGSTSSSVVRKRTSTLFAPTASSLARMQSTVRPPSLSGAASNSSFVASDTKALARVPEQRPQVQSGVPSFTFSSPPPVGGASTPNRGTGSIFTSSTPIFAPSQAPPAAPADAKPKPRALPPRRPRISRSRVIAKLGAQRAASGSSLASTSSARRSLNQPKTRGSLSARASGIGAKTGAREAAAAMSARRRLRQSEVLRRRSKVSGALSPVLKERDATPEGDSEDHSERYEEYSVSLDVSMED